jgi:hypothetical protein
VASHFARQTALHAAFATDEISAMRTIDARRAFMIRALGSFRVVWHIASPLHLHMIALHAWATGSWWGLLKRVSKLIPVQESAVNDMYRATGCERRTVVRAPQQKSHQKGQSLRRYS